MRRVAFVFLAFFIIIGPIYVQVLDKPSLLFRSWSMFSGKALGFYAVRYYIRTPKGDMPIDYHYLENPLNHKKMPGHLWKIDNDYQLSEANQFVCKALPSAKDIRVQVRTSTRKGWKLISDKEKNICQGLLL